MSSDFDKNDLEVSRHYTISWFTKSVSRRILIYDLKSYERRVGFRLAEWLVGFANLLRSASPRDGYEWVDRRTSLFSKLDAEQQAEAIAGSFPAPKVIKE